MRDLMHCSLLHSLLRTYERSTCSESKEKKAPPESRQAFEVAAAQTSGLVNLVSSRQTGFIKCEHPFIDKPMVIKKPAVASARLCGLGFTFISRQGAAHAQQRLILVDS